MTRKWQQAWLRHSVTQKVLVAQATKTPPPQQTMWIEGKARSLLPQELR